MLARCLNKLFALLLAVTPAAAQTFGGDFVLDGNAQRPQNATVTLTRGTCVSDTANATTYNGAGFQATGTGMGETDTYYPVVIAMAEDGQATFGISSMTINGVAATEVIDEDGTGLVDAALYRGGVEVSGTTINVSVTASEAVTSMVVCAWGLKNLASFTPLSSVQDDDTASGALVLTTGTTSTAGFVVGACVAERVADSTTTWAVLTEREDATSAEVDYSNADAAGTGASMSNTCDWTNTADASGVAAAFR